MAVKFNFRGTVNTLAGHKRNLANTKKRDDAVRKIQVAYRAALERRRKRAVAVNKSKTAAAKPKVKPKPKKKKLVKSKVRALLKLNRPALEKKFQNTRKLAKELACGGNRNFPLWDRRFGPKEIKKLGLTNRELVDMIRRLEQSCFSGSGFSRIPNKEERKYFAGANMSNNAKTNKNYNNNKQWNYNKQWNNLPNEYIYNNDPEINNAKNALKRDGNKMIVEPSMSNAKLRAYLRNQIINRFGVDPNKNERFIRPIDNWAWYGSPNAAKVHQYASTLRQPGKLAGKKSNPKHMNYIGPAVPTTRVGRRQYLTRNSGFLQRHLASQILTDLENALEGYRNNITWTKNLSDNDKRYAKRLINTHGPYSKKLMTNAVANNIIKRFGKRKSRAMRKNANKRRANNFKTFIEEHFTDKNVHKFRRNITKNEWLKGMGMKKMGS